MEDSTACDVSCGSHGCATSSSIIRDAKLVLVSFAAACIAIFAYNYWLQLKSQSATEEEKDLVSFVSQFPFGKAFIRLTNRSSLNNRQNQDHCFVLLLLQIKNRKLCRFGVPFIKMGCGPRETFSPRCFLKSGDTQISLCLIALRRC